MLASLLFLIPGVLYLVFAYREPPKAVEHLFRIPAIFVFFPERNRTRIGRLSAGALLVLFGGGLAVQELHHHVAWLFRR
jgi:hypothetical protein